MRYILVALVLAFTALFWRQSHATDNGQFENVSPEVRAWYRNAELTDMAKQRFPFEKCCDHSDVVKTRFAVDKSSGNDVWYWLNPASMQFELVPQDIIHWYDSAPNGEPTLFIYQGQLTCFFVPNGGV